MRGIYSKSAIFASLALISPVFAQSAGPVPAPLAMPVPPPKDIPYPGTIALSVDATDTGRGILMVKETIPVAQDGPMVLLYPEWLPGVHGPAGAIDKLAGLTITAGGKPVAWSRDTGNVYAFHITVPAGTKTLEVRFTQLTPIDSGQGRIVVTSDIVNLEWIQTALYPAGYYSRDITFAAQVKLPDDFKIATALEAVGKEADGVTRFKPVSFNTLADSPLLAGRHFNRITLDAKTKVFLDVVADRDRQLKATDDEIAKHRALVTQAYALYGSHHYDHYDFLLGLSSHVSGEGLEHHQSSEDVTSTKYFEHWDQAVAGRDLLPHEFTHSWNGKFRRPADLWTPNFNVPMGDSLLWVYEGQTQYWGYVLAARSGLWTKQQGLDAIANTAAAYANQAGRAWRPMIDTTNDPVTTQRRSIPWRDWQRSEDYYREGALIWLEADMLIREKTGGKKSLDDFARGFFGVHDGSFVTDTYTFDDVVAGLNAVMPYDWADFLKTRVTQLTPAPIAGVTMGGYRLVYSDKPSDLDKAADAARKNASFTYSLGMIISGKGKVMGVAWNSPAFKAGITLGSEITAVNGTDYDADDLRDAITDAKTDKAPIQFTIHRGDTYRTVAMDYHGGLRYPHLERIAGTPARLDDLLTAK